MWPRVDDNASIVLPRPKPAQNENNESAATATPDDPDGASSPDCDPRLQPSTIPNPESKQKPMPIPKFIPNTKSSRVLTSVDAENERLCYQHMLLITRAPDPEDDCELSPKSDQTISPGVDAGATTKPPATKMNGGTEMETKRKIESTASPAIIVKPDEKTIMGIPAGTTLCLTET